MNDRLIRRRVERIAARRIEHPHDLLLGLRSHLQRKRHGPLVLIDPCAKPRCEQGVAFGSCFVPTVLPVAEDAFFARGIRDHALSTATQRFVERVRQRRLRPKRVTREHGRAFAHAVDAGRKVVRDARVLAERVALRRRCLHDSLHSAHAFGARRRLSRGRAIGIADRVFPYASTKRRGISVGVVVPKHGAVPRTLSASVGTREYAAHFVVARGSVRIARHSVPEYEEAGPRFAPRPRRALSPEQRRRCPERRMLSKPRSLCARVC